jgi:hypothetical protein
MPVYSREDVIDYLIDHYRIAFEARQSTRSKPQNATSVDRMLAKIRRHLDGMSDFELLRHHSKILRIQWGYIATDADLEHWGRMDGWTLEEATALLLGKDPNLIDDGLLEEPYSGPYWMLQQLIYRAQELGDLPSLIRPVEMLNWADQHNVQYSEDLKRSILRDIRPSACNDPDQVREEKDCDTKLLDDISRVKDELPAKIEAIQDQKTLNPKIGQSLEKMVLGMAAAYHGYEPEEFRSKAPQEIKDELDRVGISVDVDTIRTRLREAVEEFGHLIEIEGAATKPKTGAAKKPKSAPP